MEKEYFDNLIEAITIEIKDNWEKKKKNNNDYNNGVLHGMYYVADCIQNRLNIQNDVNDTNIYADYIRLIDEIEKDLG